MFEQALAQASSSQGQLWALFRLRNLAIASQAAVVAVAVGGLGLAFPVAPLALIIAVEVAFNALVRLRLHRCWPAGEPEVCAQLVADVLFLSALLYFSGGSVNPFVSLYLVPVALAAVSLAPRYIAVVGGVAVAGYSWLMIRHRPFPSAPGQAFSNFDLHLFGMWVNFLVSAAVITVFVVAMSRSLRARDRALAAEREQQLRDEQALALGTQAAHTAHQLGTPLSTMAVLCQDWLEAYGEDPALGEDMRVMAKELERCKALLRQLGERARGEGAEVTGTLAAVVEAVLDEWHLTRPELALIRDCSQEAGALEVAADATLAPALINLVDNAADASLANQGGRVWVSAALHNGDCVIAIEDEGKGLDPRAEREAGTLGLTTKAGGLGMGLFLANASVERLGGSVRLLPGERGGTCTRVVLAKERLMPEGGG